MGRSALQRSVPTWLIVLTVLTACLVVPTIAAARMGLFGSEDAVRAADVRPLPSGVDLLAEDDDCYHGCSRNLAFAVGADEAETLDAIAIHYRSIGWPLERTELRSPPAIADHLWSGSDSRGYFTVELVRAGDFGTMFPGPPLERGHVYVKAGVLRDE